MPPLLESCQPTQPPQTPAAMFAAQFGSSSAAPPFSVIHFIRPMSVVGPKVFCLFSSFTTAFPGRLTKLLLESRPLSFRAEILNLVQKLKLERLVFALRCDEATVMTGCDLKWLNEAEGFEENSFFSAMFLLVTRTQCSSWPVLRPTSRGPKRSIFFVFFKYAVNVPLSKVVYLL